MRIAIACSGLGHVARGVETWARTLAEALHREGEDVILFHGGGEYDCPNVKLNFIKRAGLTARVITRLAPRFAWRWQLTGRYPLEQRSFVSALISYLRTPAPSEGHPDIIHTQDFVVAKRLVVRFKACSEGVRLSLPRGHVVFANGTDEPPRSLVGLPNLQHVSLPDYEAATAVPALGGTRHFLIPNSVDTTLFSPCSYDERVILRHQYGIPDNAFVIGGVGVLQRHHKRLDALIDEVATLHTHRPAPLHPHTLLVGAASDDTAFVERYARERLGPHVTILKD
jgi:1,2-diacylglycerol 3-alpha-glucosyltransferase